MYYSTFRRMPGDIDSTWGTHEVPLVQYDPLDYAERFFPVPSEMRGRHEYRQQPRALGPAASYLPDNPPGRELHGYGEHPDDQKWGFFIVLGIIGLIAFLAGRASGEIKARINPRPCSYCRRQRRIASRVARRLPRDAQGRFLPE